MKRKSATRQPAPRATVSSPAPAGTAPQERARQGNMQLAELMSCANELQSRGLAEESARLYQEWIAHTQSPHRHVACFNWGAVLGALNRHAEAEKAYRQALQMKPDFVQARLNLGHQLEHQGRIDEALAQWQQVWDWPFAASPMPETDLRLHAINNRARLLEQQRRLDEAEACLVQSLELKAQQPDVIQHYVHIRQKQCEWPVYQPVGEVTANQLLMNTSALAMLSASDDPAMQLLAAHRFVAHKYPPDPGKPMYQANRPRNDKVRIGYLSGDLCLHAMGLLIPELIELHDRERFEVFAFCWSREDGSPQRARLLAAFDHHVRLGGLDDLAAAQLIAHLNIDVLVDLQGLSSGARPGILALRPCPVQVGYLGLPATSALPGVDWMISDPYVMPPELQPYCTERAMIVPHCYQVSDRQRPVAPRPERATYELPEDAFVYCSFNNNHKFNEPVFDTWMTILAAVPGSVLWLLADNPWARENMLRRADLAGVARERLVFAPRVGPAEYLARYQLADLFLDTFPYNAGATASDALWMGTPLLTRSGRTYISRMAGSLLTNVGLPDLITTTLDEYRERAIALGRHPQRIASYKRYLAEHGRQSPLFDLPARVRDIENGFLDLLARPPVIRGAPATATQAG